MRRPDHTAPPDAMLGLLQIIEPIKIIHKGRQDSRAVKFSPCVVYHADSVCDVFFSRWEEEVGRRQEVEAMVETLQEVSADCSEQYI